jgi:hypothetical protein
MALGKAWQGKVEHVVAGSMHCSLLVLSKTTVSNADAVGKQLAVSNAGTVGKQLRCLFAL